MGRALVAAQADALAVADEPREHTADVTVFVVAHAVVLEFGSALAARVVHAAEYAPAAQSTVT